MKTELTKDECKALIEACDTQIKVMARMQVHLIKITALIDTAKAKLLKELE